MSIKKLEKITVLKDRAFNSLEDPMCLFDAKLYRHIWFQCTDQQTSILITLAVPDVSQVTWEMSYEY